jgi:hypothetical protein
LRSADRQASANLLDLFPRLYSKSMNAPDILFRTRIFNLSKVGEHFINPCCFGEDLAAWLRSRLANKNVEAGTPYQEDWGWEMPVTMEGASYYLGVSGNADEPGSDEGEWRIIVSKRRSIWERLAGKETITAEDPLLKLIEQILSGEPAITNVYRETGTL